MASKLITDSWHLKRFLNFSAFSLNFVSFLLHCKCFALLSVLLKNDNYIYQHIQLKFRKLMCTLLEVLIDFNQNVERFCISDFVSSFIH